MFSSFKLGKMRVTGRLEYIYIYIQLIYKYDTHTVQIHCTCIYTFTNATKLHQHSPERLQNRFILQQNLWILRAEQDFPHCFPVQLNVMLACEPHQFRPGLPQKMQCSAKCLLNLFSGYWRSHKLYVVPLEIYSIIRYFKSLVLPACNLSTTLLSSF